MGLRMSERDCSVMISFHILDSILPLRSLESKINMHGSALRGGVRVTTTPSRLFRGTKLIWGYVCSCLRAILQNYNFYR